MQKALCLEDQDGKLVVRERRIPVPKAGELLVRVEASGLNPSDWKIRKMAKVFLKEFPAILGFEGAGVVEEVGEGVERFSKGDRVLFPASFGIPDRATFQQYAIANATFSAKIPPSLSFEQACSVPVGLATAAVGLYVSKGVERGGVGLHTPWSEGGRAKYGGVPIVVLGGASSVGLYVIQLAKISGFFPIITTASPHNHHFLRVIGATHCIDRNDPLTPAVRAITSLPIPYVYDAVSSHETQEAGWGLLSDEGTLIVTQDPVVKSTPGETKSIVRPLAAISFPGHRLVCEPMYAHLTKLLADEWIVPHKVDVLPGGLSGIPEGLELLEENKVSGRKLVVKPQETTGPS